MNVLRFAGLLLLSSVLVGATVEVTLRPSVTLPATKATIADVADLAGEQEEVGRIAPLVIQELPDLATYTVNERTIRMTLGRSVGQTRLKITGSCELSRQTTVIGEEELIAAAKRHAQTRAEGEFEIALIRCSGAVSVPADKLLGHTLLAEPLTGGTRGELPYRIKVMRAEREIGRALVVLSVKVYRDVPVTARPVARGSKIELGDIQMRRIELGVNADVFVEDESPVGLVARCDIGEGVPYSHHQLIEEPTVAAGKPVQMIYRKNGFELTANGVSLDNGSVGAIISVRRESDGHAVKAKVLEPGLVLVNFQ